MYESATDIPAGVPVSLSVRGYVQRGGGFGIYRNLRLEKDEEMERCLLLPTLESCFCSP